MTEKILISLIFSLIMGFGASVPAYGAESPLSPTTRFTNENWYTLPHPKVTSFELGIDGSFSGHTVDGRLFMQYLVPNPYGIRVHRFEIDDHYHFIVDGEIADTFTEFSALLALAYNAREQAV